MQAFVLVLLFQTQMHFINLAATSCSTNYSAL